MLSAVINLSGDESHTPFTMNIAEDDWMECLSPLQYLLIPVGITNLFPHKTCTKPGHDKKCSCLCIWSYIYGLSLLFIPFYLFDADINVFIPSPHDNIFRYYALQITFGVSNVSAIAAWIFLRFYYLKKKYFQSLHKHLFHYLQYEDAVILEHYNYIYKHCKIAVIVIYLCVVAELIFWQVLSAQYYTTENAFSIVRSVFYVYQVQLPVLCLCTMAIIMIRILLCRYYAFSAKITHSFLKSGGKHVHAMQHKQQFENEEMNQFKVDCIDFLELHPLQTLDACDGKIQNMSMLNIHFDSIKFEYMSLSVLYQKHSKYWSVPFVVLNSIFMSMIVAGFVMFFDYNSESGSSASGWLLAASMALIVWSVVVAAVFFSHLANLNTISEELKGIIIVIYHMHTNQSMYGDMEEDGHAEHNDSALQLVELIAIHPCSFQILGVEMNWSRAMLLVTTAASPVISFGITYFWHQLKSGAS